MKVLNRTHYYSPYTRVYNEVPDVDSFANESAKRMSYQQRLYYEFEDTKRCNGIAFFYSFTYNDNALPLYMGIPCFNYDHIRLITNGVIKHELRRKYGSQLRYFCACEVGEGKGKRGIGNNPHYHFIFFVSPLRDKDNNPILDNYKKIAPKDFQILCRRVWQYRKNDKTNKFEFCDYKEARFGHVQAGNHLGEIDCGDAFGYVSKYVTKSELDKERDNKVSLAISQQLKDEGYTLDSLYNFYLYVAFNNAHGSTRPGYTGIDSMPLYKYFLDSDNRRQFYEDSGLQQYQNFRRNPHNPIRKSLSFADFCRLYHPMKQDFFEKYVEFHRNSYLPDVFKQLYSEYKNMYGNKVRCSKSLGLYGLTQIQRSSDGLDVQLRVTSSSQVMLQSPCLYYIRKLFYDTTICPYTGNVLYTLNDDGVNYKVAHLHKSACQLVTNVKESISFCTNKNNSNVPEIRTLFCNSSSALLSTLSMISKLPDLDDTLYKYSIYRLVYKYRHYDDEMSFCLHDGCTIEDIKEDYRTFLCNIPAFGLHTLLIELKKGNYTSFSCHPYFAPYKTIFDALDKAYDAYQCFVSGYHKAIFKRKGDARKKYCSERMNYLIDGSISFEQLVGPNYSTQFLTL